MCSYWAFGNICENLGHDKFSSPCDNNAPNISPLYSQNRLLTTEGNDTSFLTIFSKTDEPNSYLLDVLCLTNGPSGCFDSNLDYFLLFLIFPLFWSFGLLYLLWLAPDKWDFSGVRNNNDPDFDFSLVISKLTFFDLVKKQSFNSFSCRYDS